MPEHGVRHDRDDEQESKHPGRQEESLNMPKRRRRQKYGKPVLQRPHPSEKSWLESRTSARRFGDLEQQRAVRGRVAKPVHYAIVAVHLNCQAQPSQLPPHREIPRHQ